MEDALRKARLDIDSLNSMLRKKNVHTARGCLNRLPSSSMADSGSESFFTCLDIDALSPYFLYCSMAQKFTFHQTSCMMKVHYCIIQLYD
ncbi:hypothetical protein [Paenibacillus sp. DYY-L-2]|uniref:hypothetical protein n=1 Tax=Paenibacillus sp. DYY-L-2 TaxID=3447013 RepID=UPI003F4F8117